MQNPININSTNIQTFGFKSTIDLLAKTLTFDITALTVFNSGGASAVLGIAFSVIDPSGLAIATIDWTAPSIVPASASTFVVDLVGGFAMFGFYQITGIIKDADNKLYPITFTKEVCQPDGFVKNGFVNGKFDVVVDCGLPGITINDLTKYVYKGTQPDSVTKSGVLSYPKDTLEDLGFTFTPFSITGQGKVYTGRYTINNTSVATFDLKDGVYLNVSYQIVSFERIVNCNSALSNILCCMTDLQDEYENDPFSNSGLAIKKKLDKVALSFQLALIMEKSGKDASDEVAKIAKVLGCDCGCGSDAIEPKAIFSGNTEVTNMNIVGQNALSASSAVVSGTTIYTLNVKNVAVTNPNNDTSFTINRVVSGTTITYAITLNMTVLAENLLTAIQNDEDLTNLLNSIITATNAGVSLDGLNGGCIISLANCNYSLIEINNYPKTIASITIGGTVHNAPGGLLLSNTSGVATWLNGLGLGTFTVNSDSGSIIINSNANPNVITAFSMTSAPGPLQRLFVRSCTGLVAFLNAVVTYVCALNATQVKFGATGQHTYSEDGGGDIVATSIDPSTPLANVLELMLATDEDLYTKLGYLGLTCTNIQNQFQPLPGLPVITTDGLLGIRSSVCARYTFDNLAGIILDSIAADANWITKFCNLVAGCSAPVCPSVTNVSAVFASGTLTVNCNDAGSSSAVKVRYRIYNSGATFTEVSTTSGALPLAITGLVNGQYEVQVSKQCSSNSVWSPWVSAISNNTCTPVVSFGVTISGSNFVVAATLTSPQTKVFVQMTDPLGAVTGYLHDFGATSGTFNIAIPASNYGNYTFVAQAICDATATPMFGSIFGAPVTVNNPNPTINNIRASASYGMTFTDISNGTASGIPASFNGSVNSGNQSDTTPSLSSGTIHFTVTGTPPTTLTIYGRLVLNGTTIVSQVTITAAGTYTLTNTSLIAYPNMISIEIDS